MDFLFVAVTSLIDGLQNLLGSYIDIDFTLWLFWLFLPLLLFFLLPLIILILLYISAIILYIFRFHRRQIREALQTDLLSGGLKAVAALWDAHGWLWHGYEVSGIENLPEGPALLIYYHGTLPVDLYYLISRVYLLKNRLIHSVADRFLFRIPGWGVIAETAKVIPGTVQTCTEVLKQGNMLAISPGGVFEAQFGDHNYHLMWKGRNGFAKVALNAQVCIVPVFTQNVREAFRCVSFLQPLMLRLYAKIRFPLVPLYGGFPVKMVTHIGKPIPPDPSLSPQELHVKINEALTGLIETHQRKPGSIIRALWERIYMTPKLKPD